MEEKIRKKAVYKNKVDHYETETYYVTSDGKEFIKEKDAKHYEELLEKQLKANFLWDGIKKINADDFLFFDGSIWYFASNEEELEAIKQNCQFYDKYNYQRIYGNIQVGEWITNIYEDGGDYRGTNKFYTFTYVKEEMTKFLENFE